MNDYVAGRLIQAREADLQRRARRPRLDRRPRSWGAAAAGRALRAGFLGATAVVSRERPHPTEC